MPKATIIEDIQELDRLQLVWRALWQRTRQASFFQTLDWLRLYWHHFGQDQRLKVIIVEECGEVIGIVPLVVRVETTRIGPVRTLTYPLHDWGTFYGPLGAEPTVTLATSFRAIQKMRSEWDLVDLRWVNRDEVDQGRTPIAMTQAGFPCREGIWRTTAVIDFAGNWSEYLASRSTKFRNNLRRAESAGEQAGGISFRRYRPDPWIKEDQEVDWKIYDECLRLAESSWQSRSTDGTTISHPPVRPFFRDLFELAASQGALDVTLLSIDEKLAAFAFNLHNNGSIYGLRLGYDPAAESLSPGRLLLARSIEDSFRRGDKRFDLGSESMSFKNSWLTRTLDCHRYTHYPIRSWRGQLLLWKHWVDAGSESLKGTSGRTASQNR